MSHLSTLVQKKLCSHWSLGSFGPGAFWGGFVSMMTWAHRPHGVRARGEKQSKMKAKHRPFWQRYTNLPASLEERGPCPDSDELGAKDAGCPSVSPGFTLLRWLT